MRSADGALALHDLRGKVVLLYFGYTHCPDACPTALGVMARAVRSLPQAMQRRTALLFVSLDPERDTPELLKRYTAFFDPRMVGATTTPQRLQRIAAAWRVSYRIPPHAPGAEYAVSHSSFIYLIDPQGRLVDLFGDGTRAEAIAAAMRAWL